MHLGQRQSKGTKASDIETAKATHSNETAPLLFRASCSNSFCPLGTRLERSRLLWQLNFVVVTSSSNPNN